MSVIPKHSAFVGTEFLSSTNWIWIEQGTAVRTNINILVKTDNIIFNPSQDASSFHVAPKLKILL
jgi:hypothetical protein